MPRWDAWLAGLAEVLGPLLLTVPPNLGSRKPRDLARDAPARLAAPRPGRAHDRRRDPADDDEHRRPARRLVRVAAGQGRARRQRRDRHLGRPVRAGHRLRDGAPLDRRRRRRAPGQLGLPGGRHGRGLRRDRGGRARARRRDPDRRQGRQASSSRTAGPRAWCWRTATSSAPGSSCPRVHPRIAFLDHVGRENLPADFVSDIEHWKTRSGVVKINLALAELPDFIADPGTQPAGAPHRLGRDGADDGVHRARLPGRPRGQPGRPAVQRRRDPDRVRQDAVPRGHAHHVAVHPVGAGGLERGAAHRRSSRPTPTG